MRNELPLPVVFTTDLLMRRGMTPAQIRARIHRGEFRRLRRAAYCRARDWDAASPEERHAIEAAAYAMTHMSSAPFAFSHATAAAMLGLPVEERHLGLLRLTVDPCTRLTTRRDDEIDRQVARLREVDVRVTRGLRSTTPARTVADCLRRLPAADAVAIADDALRRGQCSMAQVREVLEWQAEWPFAAVGALALELVDARRESPLESKSAVVMHQHRVPSPEPQVRIDDAHGRFVARVDFAWVREGVVGEVDGRVKYAEDAARVIEAEKDRQARLEALGLVVVRWDARHLFGDVPVMVQRVMAALSMGDGRRFRGRAA
jgi:very-short-patch-repair endonuclease